MSSEPPSSAASPDQQALEAALARLLEPLARLVVARGVPYAVVEEMLKRACVDAAAAAHPQLAPHRRVSRIATATGINRREVTRLTQARPRARTAERPRSLASAVFAHWRTQPPYVNAAGRPRPLPRQGPAPSFESLAQEITRDVHPRSLLEELVRLGLAELDGARDEVSLKRDIFVPGDDRPRMYGLMGANVGDHLAAAVENLLVDDTRHFEQAVWAEGLSEQSLAALRPLVAAQWRTLVAAMVPALQAAVDADAARADGGAPPRGRFRLGLYEFTENQVDAPGSDVDGDPS
jgi:hypothetical protein